MWRGSLSLLMEHIWIGWLPVDTIHVLTLVYYRL